MKRNSRGFTLIELMTSITVLGVLLGLAVPSFRATIRNNRIAAQTNELVGALNYARSEALKRGNSVSVCSSTDGTTCAVSNTWSTGWIAFTDMNGNGNTDGADAVLQQWPETNAGVALTSTTRTFVRYASTGTSSGAETFDLIPSNCSGNYARRITVTVTGRIGSAVAACP
jgi:type IV fimbrial biogenesis protein FimT